MKYYVKTSRKYNILLFPVGVSTAVAPVDGESLAEKMGVTETATELLPD